MNLPFAGERRAQRSAAVSSFAAQKSPHPSATPVATQGHGQGDAFEATAHAPAPSHVRIAPIHLPEPRSSPKTGAGMMRRPPEAQANQPKDQPIPKNPRAPSTSIVPAGQTVNTVFARQEACDGVLRYPILPDPNVPLSHISDAQITHLHAKNGWQNSDLSDASVVDMLQACRAAEIGLPVKVTSLDKVASQMTCQAPSIALLRRFARAFNVPTKNITFHGRQIDEWRVATRNWSSFALADQVIDELNTLPGLENVKSFFRSVSQSLQIGVLESAMGFDWIKPSFHVAFTGSPGTGKTTAARSYGQLLLALGLTRTSKFLEVSRADLVAGVAGQTAIKVRSKLAEAKGGILFIDEVYSLATDHNDAFGLEAINELITYMENNRDDFVLVVAGYPDKLRAFCAKNPGMGSRISAFVDFNDLTASEMLAAIDYHVGRMGYSVSREVLAQLQGSTTMLKHPNFANGRTARNLAESAIRVRNARSFEIDQEALFRGRARDKNLTLDDFAPQLNEFRLNLQPTGRQLQELVGLDTVKKDIEAFFASMKMNALRKRRGFSVPKKMNVLITGVPGSGKSTLASAIGEEFTSLSSDKRLIKASYTHFIAPYHGQTRDKTRTFLESAVGHVLLIENIDQLVKGNDESINYNQEALDELFVCMETYGDQLPVIMTCAADLSGKLHDTLSAHLGITLPIPPYDEKDLTAMFEKRLQTVGFHLETGLTARQVIDRCLPAQEATPRGVERLFNKILGHLDARLLASILAGQEPDNTQLSTFCSVDLPVEESSR